MKLAFSFFFILIFSVANAQRNIDVLHYKFSIEINDNNDTIYGKAEIQLKLLSPIEEIKFDLVTLNKSGKGMITDQVIGPGIRAINNKNDAIRIIYSPESDKTLIDTLTYIITYHGIPADGLVISKTKYGKRSFFADNWPDRGHNWLPCHDDPADKATVEFIVTAPQHYQVVSNGIQIEESNLPNNKKRTHWKEDIPISTKVMVIGVAEFAVNLSGTIDNCIPVYSWVYPEDKDNGFYDYAQAAEILPWFIKNIGPYAYKKLANVQSKTMFGGLENANTIFYSENSINGKRRSESLLVHEIAHQWFGNHATEKSFAHLWLSEGFATYMTILYLENKYGQDTALALLKEDRQQAIDFGKSNPLPVVNTTKDYMQLLNANSYQKGGWLLHMLRRQLGDSVFMESIRHYYKMYAGKTADSKDLQKVFESVAHKDFEVYFQQWLYNPVNPKLKISWKFIAATKTISVKVDQLQHGPAFQFPLEIAVHCAGAIPKIHTIHLNSKTESFELSASAKPISLIADPNVSLLFEGTITEIK